MNKAEMKVFLECFDGIERFHEKVYRLEQYSGESFATMDWFRANGFTDMLEMRIEFIEQAIEIAMRKDIFSLDYVRGILKNWNGKTLEEVFAPRAAVGFQTAWEQSAPFTNEFIGMLQKLSGISGVYAFFDGANPLYVGKSNNLGARILSSYTDKHKKYEQGQVTAHFVCSNNTDAGILELYFISLFSPIYNKKDKSEEPLTLVINPIPKFSDGVLVLRRER